MKEKQLFYFQNKMEQEQRTALERYAELQKGFISSNFSGRNLVYWEMPLLVQKWQQSALIFLQDPFPDDNPAVVDALKTLTREHLIPTLQNLVSASAFVDSVDEE